MKRTVSQSRTRSDRRRSGSARTDHRTNAVSRPTDKREPDDLGGLAVDERERRHGEREGRQVLEPEVSVLGAIERLAGERADGGRAVDVEVDHLARDARLIDGGRDGETDQGPEERPEPAGHVQ